MNKCANKFFRTGMSVLTRSCLLGAGLVLSAAACAAGADLPASPAPVVKAPAVTPTYDWTGFYIGGHGSFSWSNSSGTLTNTATGIAFPSTGGHSSSAWHGGGQIGYDYMMPSHVVIGIVADVSSGTSNTTTNSFPASTTTTQAETFASGTVRGRLGYAIDNVLLYGTAGWHWADAESTRTQIAGQVGNAVAGTVETANANRDGWTAGAGVAYALTRNWNAFTEYRYSGVSSTIVTFPLAQRSITSSSSNNSSVIEFGLNYKFDWGAAQAAARY
jgi:opacity protein-like surface antigen